MAHDLHAAGLSGRSSCPNRAAHGRIECYCWDSESLPAFVRGCAESLEEGGLKRRGKILLMHVRSIDKRRITRRYGAVSPETMREVDEALKVATGLTRV